MEVDVQEDKENICKAHSCRTTHAGDPNLQFCDACSMEQKVYHAIKNRDLYTLKHCFNYKSLRPVHMFSSLSLMDVHNETILMLVVKEQFFCGLQFLLFDRVGVSGDISTSHAQDAFLYAVRGRMKDVIKLFLKAFIEDRISMDIAHVFHMAMSTGQLDFIPFIMDKPMFNCEMVITWGLVRPLHIAVVCQQDAVIKLLLEKGARVDIMDHKGKTPLIFACCLASPTCTKILLQHGADPNHKASCGEVVPPISPLYALLKFSHGPSTANIISITEYLVDAGLNLQDEQWIMTTDICRPSGISIDTHTWLKKLYLNPKSLKTICSVALRTRLSWLNSGTRIPALIKKLPLPTPVISYLLLNHI